MLLLRWFWWRINAWSEVSAMAVAAVVSLYLQIALRWDGDQPRDFAYIMLVTVGIDDDRVADRDVRDGAGIRTPHSAAFYQQVRPHGPQAGRRLRRPSAASRRQAR